MKDIKILEVSTKTGLTHCVNTVTGQKGWLDLSK